MRKIVINSFGNAEVLRIVEEDVPKINDNQVLVKVKAFSLNPVEYKIRRGDLKFITGKKFPRQLGSDISGEIIKVGTNAPGFKPGDHVYGMLNYLKSGGYTEHIAVDPNMIARKPENLRFEEAAALPMAGLTSLQTLQNYAAIKSGDKLLVNGASGGVGHCAVQIAANLGSEVTAVCSSRNMTFVKSLGAKNVIDYTRTNVTGLDQKFDVIFDVVANQKFSGIKNLLTNKGIYISTLPSPGIILKMFLLPLISGKRVKYIMVKPSNSDMMKLTIFAEQNKLKPFIEKVYRFEDVVEAHKKLESNRVKGKLVIKVNEEYHVRN